MIWRYLRRRISFGATAVAVAVVYIVVSYGLYNHANDQIGLEGKTVSAPVNVVNPADIVLVRGRETNCTTGVLRNLQIPICVYDNKDDVYVSRDIRQQGYYHAVLVVATLDWLKKLQAMTSHVSGNSVDDVIFIDIGANLGTFTLAAAHSGFHVVAVEANWKTLRHLATSIVLGKVTDRVTLLHNAVSNTTGSTVHLGFGLTNRGWAWIMPSPELCRQRPPPAGCPGDNEATEEHTVETVTLDDLLPIVEETGRKTQQSRRRVILKIDIEGSELQTFNRQTANRFLTQVDVVAAVVEWMWFRAQPKTNADIDELVRFIVDEHGYRVMNTNVRPLQDITDRHWLQWPNDVYFVKPQYVKLIGG